MTLFKVMENRDIIKLLINLNFWMNNLDIIKEQYDNIKVASQVNVISGGNYED